MHKQLRIKAKTGPFSSLSWESFGLLLVSAVTFIFEINLTRLYSVAQFYHFAFMVVSIALLGFGASGTFLAQIETRSRAIVLELFPWLAGASGLSMLASFVLIKTLPFDSFSIAVDPTQIAILVLHYTALALPFSSVGLL